MAQKVLRPLWKKENQNLKENKMSEISKEELPKKMIEVLGSIYDFPHSLAETGRGDQQYQEITRAVEENPSVKQLVKQLEAEYDKGQINPDLDAILDPTLPPEVENFLNEMGQRFEEGPADSEETLK